MNYLTVSFDDLYRRHLCRHGHFGINMLHLIAVVGIDVAVIGLVDRLADLLVGRYATPLLFGLALVWLVLIVRNLPASIALATAATFALLILCTQALQPFVPWPVWLLLIPALHRFQQWSHSVYPMHRDMSEFDDTYRKGAKLFVILLMYELPILLNYFLYGQADWTFGRGCLAEDSAASVDD